MRIINKHIVLLIILVFLFICTTNSFGFYMKEYGFSREALRASSVQGACKIYSDDEAFYYTKNESGSYAVNITEIQMLSLRNDIKNAVNSLENKEYLVSRIKNDTAYYDSVNKEFCFKRQTSSTESDSLVKVIILGYDDNYQFKGNVSSAKGAYKVRKVKETEEFYVSYEDTWIESDLSYLYDANRIELSKNDIEMRIGDTVQVQYTVLPEDAISKNVTVEYSSGIEIDLNETGIVKITAQKAGDNYIIVKLKNDNTISATCVINVLSNTPEPSPSPVAPSPSPVVPSPSTVVPSPSPVVPSPSPVVPSPSPVVQDENIISTKYIIDSESKQIYRILPKIKVLDFMTNIVSNVEYRIYTRNDSIVSNTGINVATGMKLRTTENEYTLIVLGDVNGDGKISLTDTVRANLFSIHLLTPNNNELLASDINGDGKIGLTDVVRINLASINIKEI